MGETAEDAAASGKVLTQAEIDSLLGYGDGPGGTDPSGMQRVISAGLVNCERLPMLEIVVNRLVRIMSTSLRNLTSGNMEAGIDNVVPLRFSPQGSVTMPRDQTPEASSDQTWHVPIKVLVETKAGTPLPRPEKRPKIKALLDGSECLSPGQPPGDPAASPWSWQGSARARPVRTDAPDAP